MKLQVNKLLEIITKDKKGSPIGKAHIMAKKPSWFSEKIFLNT